jgi:ActR/RegA family two-component response regulator
MIELTGTFATNGAAAPAATSQFSSEEVTITYAATGKYTLTFQRYFAEQYGAGSQLRMAAGALASSYAAIDSVTLNSSGVLVVVLGTYNNADAATAIAAGAQNWVSWNIWVRE